MAIYHLSVKAISRSAGRSATAAAAYRAATRIQDERTGLVHDYSRKAGVLHREIIVPDDAPAWARDRAQLWNAAELAETRKNSTVAREIEVALPTEISPQHRRELACALAHEITARHRCAVDIAIHAPARRSDERNHHAHLLMTTRRFNADGLTEKTRELDDLKTGEVTRWRERWAALVNEHLASHGHTDRVDHRSLEAQGLDRDPTFHKGHIVTAIERRGETAHVAERVREEVTERLQRAAELGRLDRESHELARSIIDTTTQLEAALAERDAERTRAPEEIRRDAQAAWLATRAGPAEAVPQPLQAERTLDLSGDLASARREAREQWLAQRDAKTATPADATERQDRGQPPPKLILPDDAHTL
jgi:ATP-dependent exoDNAse (exonuclease V) alpha subunit